MIIWLFLSLFGTLIYALYLYGTWTYDYWKKRGVPDYPATPFIGNMHDAFGLLWGIGGMKFLPRMYQENHGRKYTGLFLMRKPMLFVGDPSLIKDICIKDSEYFVNTVAFDTGDGIFSRMLFNAKDTRWKHLRSAMSPAFTSNRMRKMAPAVEEVAKTLFDHLVAEGSSSDGVDIKAVMGNFTMDTIAAVAFGFESNSFKGNSTFTTHAKTVFNPEGLDKIIQSLSFFSPELCKLLNLHPMKKPMEFFKSVALEMKSKRKEEGGKYADMMQLLMDGEEEKNGKKEYHLTEDDLIAQAVMFFIVAYDTTASALTFISWMLAIHPETQEKARDEVLEVLKKHDGKVSHDSVAEMHYMEAVINETLRIFPVAIGMLRECNADYKLGDTGLTIEKGNVVLFPAAALHRDPLLWPNPMTFDPERFMPGQKENITPYSFFPFGVGPRMCLGMRLAQLEIKIALAVILRDLTLSPTATTPHNHDIEFKNGGGLLQANRPIRLIVEKR